MSFKSGPGAIVNNFIYVFIVLQIIPLRWGIKDTTFTITWAFFVFPLLDLPPVTVAGDLGSFPPLEHPPVNRAGATFSFFLK